jgi:hypothetical protein
LHQHGVVDPDLLGARSAFKRRQLILHRWPLLARLVWRGRGGVT